MPAESDPLLPQGKSAPEISGHGFSKRSQYQPAFENQSDSPQYENNADTASVGPSSAAPSPLRMILVFFCVVVGIAFIISLSIVSAPGPSFGQPDRKHDPSITARVDKILTETPLIDGHNDLAILIRFVYHNRIYDKEFTSPFEGGGFPYHVDLPRLKAGRVGGSFWSAFVPCPKNGTDFSNSNYAESVAMTFSQIDLIDRLTAAYSDTFSPPNLNSTSAFNAFRTRKSLISPIGVEGLHQIGNSFFNIRLFHSLGVKYITLTHNCHNIFADAALVTDSSGTVIAAPPHWGGLSQRGTALVREMNRLGMLIDLAHVSKDTMLDVLGGRPEKTKGSLAPVIFSHSSAYALCPHPRNVQDDILKLVKNTNSVVMVNFSPDFISCVSSRSSTGLPDFYPANSTLHQVARHVVYIGKFIGYDHVGLGSDYDGIFSTPEGLEDVSKFPDLVVELLREGVSDEDVKKVVGLNILRVWSDAEKMAEKMQTEGVLPLEDEIPSMSMP